MTHRALSNDADILTEYDLDDLVNCLVQIYGYHAVATALATQTGERPHPGLAPSDYDCVPF